VFSAVDVDSELAQEEVFGPVLSIFPADDTDDAVRIANSTRYGLSGAVWSADAGRAREVALRMRTGRVAINGGPFSVSPRSADAASRAWAPSSESMESKNSWSSRPCRFEPIDQQWN